MPQRYPTDLTDLEWTILLPLVFHRPGTEIFGLTLELRERIQAGALLREVLEGLCISYRQCAAHPRGHPVLFLGERGADQLLQKAVAGRDDPMLVQVMEEFLEDIDRLRGHRRGMLGLGGELLPGMGITAPIVAQRQDQMVLLEPRTLIDNWLRVLLSGVTS